MRKFFIKEPLGKEIEILGTEHNHLANVLRLKTGELITVCRGDEFDYIYQIATISRNSTVLHFVRREINFYNPAANLTVFLALIKFDNLALAVQKLNEIGVTEIILFSTANSNIPVNSVNTEKLNTVAEQSCKQCKRSIPVAVRGILSFDNVLDESKKFGQIICADGRGDGTLGTVVPGSQSTALIIGPEGGFTSAEMNKILTIQNIKAVALGKRTLRTETAAIVSAAVIMSKIGEI